MSIFKAAIRSWRSVGSPADGTKLKKNVRIAGALPTNLIAAVGSASALTRDRLGRCWFDGVKRDELAF
jgi:hypothetical protein